MLGYKDCGTRNGHYGEMSYLGVFLKLGVPITDMVNFDPSIDK